MSKFDIVQKALKENPLVVIVNLDLQDYFPNRNGYFTQTADFWIAPKRGLYTADSLQGFMVGLVPGIKPISRDNFIQYYDRLGDVLEFGKLYFDEEMGIPGETQEHWRRTLVRPFPTVQFAKDALEEKVMDGQYGVTLDVLKRYKPSPLRRVAGLLGIER